MVKPWQIISSQNKGDMGLFRLRSDKAISPRNGYTKDFLVLEMADWVQLVPFTENGEVVFVEQYRFGNRKVGLEVPGGLVDKEDPNPQIGALRELEEETGYAEGEIIDLGSFWPQPAMMANKVHFYVCKNLKLKGPKNQDQGEDIRVVLLKPHEVDEAISKGKIHNAMSVLAWQLAKTTVF